MKVLLAGAGGFIGRHVAGALRAAGHEVVASRLRFQQAAQPAAWAGELRGVDAVVNAVGILRERGAQTFETLHAAAPRALFDACVAAGVRRVVQVSALGADEAAESRFHRSKRRADEHLATLELDWAVVQPSIVFGEGGASARLFALLASLPLIPLPGRGSQQVQPIHVEDLAALVARLVAQPPRRIVPAVGPRALSVREWLAMLRRQMGLGAARFVRIPLALVPMDRETLRMLERGNTASAEAAAQLLGRAPRPPEAFVGEPEAAALATRARLDWLLPALRAAVALVWIGSGVASLAYPVQESLALLARVGMESELVLYGAAWLDIALGVAICLLKDRRWLWRAQMALIAGYSAAVALWLPEFWLHPFAPMLKNLPMLAAIVALHELEGRR